MSELAEPLALHERARLRLEVIVRLTEQVNRVGLLLRQELAAFANEDIAFGYRDDSADEIGLAVKESSRAVTGQLEHAQMMVCFPAVMARVALPLSEGGWSLKHADALLDTMAACAWPVTAKATTSCPGPKDGRQPATAPANAPTTTKPNTTTSPSPGTPTARCSGTPPWTAATCADPDPCSAAGNPRGRTPRRRQLGWQAGDVASRSCASAW